MSFKNLIAYQKGFELAMDIFEISKSFPKEETFALTNQIRKSSRSTCANIAETYRKRNYPKHFISKLSDSDSENSETQVWLDFSESCNYLSLEKKEILINYMNLNPEKFEVKTAN